jgi:hypothetical protein
MPREPYIKYQLSVMLSRFNSQLNVECSRIHVVSDMYPLFVIVSQHKKTRAGWKSTLAVAVGLKHSAYKRYRILFFSRTLATVESVGTVS